MGTSGGTTGGQLPHPAGAPAPGTPACRIRVQTYPILSHSRTHCIFILETSQGHKGYRHFIARSPFIATEQAAIPVSLIPQRVDGIELRSLPRRIKTEENPHERADNKRTENPISGRQNRPAVLRGHDFGPGNTVEDSEGAGNDA